MVAARLVRVATALGVERYASHGGGPEAWTALEGPAAALALDGERLARLFVVGAASSPVLFVAGPAGYPWLAGEAL